MPKAIVNNGAEVKVDGKQYTCRILNETVLLEGDVAKEYSHKDFLSLIKSKSFQVLSIDN
jgi:hypothetical protein